MRHPLSPLHLPGTGSLWVQGDLTNFSGPGLNPLVFYLCRGAGREGGSLSLAGSRGEHLQGEREVFTTGCDSILSLHSGDNVIIYPAGATVYHKGRAYNFARAPRGKKRKNNVSPNLLGSSLLPNPNPDSPLRSDSFTSQEIPIVAKPHRHCFHSQRSVSPSASHTLQPGPCPSPKAAAETRTLVAFQNSLNGG